MDTEEVKKLFFKKVNELRNDIVIEGEKDGELHEFGFKTNCDNNMFNIVDFENIWKFIDEELKEAWRDGYRESSLSSSRAIKESFKSGLVNYYRDKTDNNMYVVLINMSKKFLESIGIINLSGKDNDQTGN